MKVNTYLKEQKVRERNRSENRRKGQTNWEKCGENSMKKCWVMRIS